MEITDSNIIYHILSYNEPSQEYLQLFPKNHNTHSQYKKLIQQKNIQYTADVLRYVCKPIFLMDVFDNDYQDYEDLQEYLLTHHYIYNRNDAVYQLDQYIPILKDLSRLLMHIGIDKEPTMYTNPYNDNKPPRMSNYNEKYNIHYKGGMVYSKNVYALLL